MKESIDASRNLSGPQPSLCRSFAKLYHRCFSHLFNRPIEYWNYWRRNGTGGGGRRRKAGRQPRGPERSGRNDGTGRGCNTGRRERLRRDERTRSARFAKGLRYL